MFYDLREIYLRELQKSDLEGNWYRWFNDQEITKFQDKRIFPNSYEKQLSYYNYLQSSNSDLVLAIVDKESELHIGNIGLHKIDYIHRRCEVGIIIGEKEYWGKGYASRCIEYITHYAFNILNLNRVTSIIMVENIASVKAFNNVKYQIEGTLKSYFYKDGKYMDAVIMAILKDNQ